MSTELKFAIPAVAFGMFALAEFYSQIAENRKHGYCMAFVFILFMVIFVTVANIGTIIYGTE